MPMSQTENNMYSVSLLNESMSVQEEIRHGNSSRLAKLRTITSDASTVYIRNRDASTVVL